MTQKSLHNIRSDTLVGMHMNKPQGTKMHFLCLARVSRLFKAMLIFQILEDRPMFGNFNVETYGTTQEVAIDFRHPKIACF